MNCGTRLLRPCTNCATMLPPSARFCLSCGHPVGEPLAQEQSRLAEITGRTPSRLAEKMRGAQHLAGERRPVTVLFADVVGSTAIAEGLDPEDWNTVMNQAFDRLIPAIYRYEGTVARLMGDGVLAFFGAPVAHEDDPIRAVRAALDLLGAAGRFANELSGRLDLEFAVRVGINTGTVVVGAVGSDLVYEYTAMGDAVNLASRLQAAAPPMGVLISEQTARYVRPIFDLEPLGDLSMKGKRDPVRTFRVVGEKTRPDPLRGLADLSSPMVGRESELAQLLQAAAAVRAGLGGAVLVLGEPGLGKSRIVEEWRRAADALEDLRWCLGRCLSYGQGLAYHLLVDLLRGILGIPLNASEQDAQAALDVLGAEYLGPDADELVPFLAHLLNLSSAGEDLKDLDPGALQAQYLVAISRLIRELAARQPLILVLDDIHWADPASIDLLVKLIPIAVDAPVQFCLIARPNRESAGWRLVEACRQTLAAGLTELNLQALSQDESRQLVSNLLEVEALPDQVRQIILDRAEGNPFFVEEVIRMLLDRGALVREEGHWVAAEGLESIEIPGSLQGLLLARIDRLPEDARQVLRVAAVIGRMFSARLLAEVLEHQRRV